METIIREEEKMKHDEEDEGDVVIEEDEEDEEDEEEADQAEDPVQENTFSNGLDLHHEDSAVNHDILPTLLTTVSGENQVTSASLNAPSTPESINLMHQPRQESLEEQALSAPSKVDAVGSKPTDEDNSQSQEKAKEDQSYKRESVVYMKKLLAVAKRSIEDWKRKNQEKATTISQQELTIRDLKEKQEKVVGLAKRAQKRIEDLETKLKAVEPLANETSGSGGLPTRVLIRVDVPQTNSVWCFCEVVVSEDATEWEWMEEDEVYCRVGDHDLPFELPPTCLSPDRSSEIEKHEAELRAELEQVKEKFRKYKVRNELVRKQKESELQRLSEAVGKFRQTNVISDDLLAQLESTKAEVERLTRAQSESEKAIRRYKTQNQQLTQDVLRWKDRFETVKAASDAEQSRFQHDSSPAVQSWSKDSLQSFNSTSSSSDVNANLLDQFSKLEREYEKYREHVQSIVEQKDATIKTLTAELESRRESHDLSSQEDAESTSKDSDNAPSSTRNSKQKTHQHHNHSVWEKKLEDQQRAADTERAYIKNIVLNYMSAETSAKEPMEAALATALQFTPQEVEKLHEKRLKHASTASPSGWFGF